MRILITGAGGQLGHDLIEVLASHELHPLTHRELDITDERAVGLLVRETRPEVIVNSAAFNDVDGAESNRAAAFAANGDGPGYLAAAAVAIGARMIQVSTDYVFDGRKGSPYVESDQANPLSVYAKSKLEGERKVLESGANACVLRTAWLYGHHGKNFVKAIQGAAQKGGPLKVVADQVGSPTATRDLAEAIAQLLLVAARGIFHVVNSGFCSRYEFARAIVENRVEVLPISTAEAHRPAARPANSSLVSDRWGSLNLPALQSWQAALSAYLTSRATAS